MIIPFCLIAGMFLACGGTEKQTADEPQVVDSTGSPLINSSAFRIAILPITECKPFLYADSCGLFDSLGVNVELITYLSAMDADTALINKRVHMSVADEMKFYFLKSQYPTDSIQTLLDIPLKLSLITSKSARIRNTKSLKEKIIAVTRNSALDYFTDRIADEALLAPLEINRPQINDIRLRKEMLMQAQYDGAILPEPWATECVDSGAVRVTTTEKTHKVRLHVLVCDSVQKAEKENIDKVMKALDIARERL